MRANPQILLLLLLAASLSALPACSPGQGTKPAPVASYGPASQSAPAPYAAQPARYPAPGAPTTYARAPVRVPPAPAAYGTQPGPMRGPTRGPSAPMASSGSGAFRWHTRLADAQAQARRENKYILVGSTQAGCSLCVKFKNQIVPQAGTRLSSVAVGFMLDLSSQSPDIATVWPTLKTRLGSGGNLMPLVGIFTPDMQYVTGFGGPTDLNELLGALSTAQRMRPVAAKAPERAFPARSPGSAQLRGGREQRNEFGEYEWTPLADLYPAPVDALGPDAGRPGTQALPPAGAPVLAAVPVPAVPVVAALETSPPPPPTPRPAPIRAAPRPAPRPAPVRATPIAAPVAAVPAARPKPPFHREPEPATQTWAQNALRQALQQIQAGDLDGAKSTLAEVHARMPGTTLAREAAKGSVAVYNAERIQAASDAERERLRSEAHRNLQASMWGVLFAS